MKTHILPTKHGWKPSKFPTLVKTGKTFTDLAYKTPRLYSATYKNKSSGKPQAMSLESPQQCPTFNVEHYKNILAAISHVYLDDCPRRF